MAGVVQIIMGRESAPPSKKMRANENALFRAQVDDDTRAGH